MQIGRTKRMKNYRYIIYQVRANVPFAFLNWKLANKMAD